MEAYEMMAARSKQTITQLANRADTKPNDPGWPNRTASGQLAIMFYWSTDVYIDICLDMILIT